MKHSTDTLKMLRETKQETAKRGKLRGLAHRMQSKEFLCDLGLMYDVLSELTNLSQQLQAHSITLLRAEQLACCNARIAQVKGVVCEEPRV